MAMNKNAIIGVLGFLLIVGGAVYLNRANLGLGGVIPIPTSTEVRRSGEVSMEDLAKLSGCSLPLASDTSENKYDLLAKCLTEKGVKMYGAFWCGHCQNQKKAFGSSFQYINYQECTIDGKQNSFAQVCQDAGIEGYPTWIFPQGSEQIGSSPNISPNGKNDKIK